MFPLHPLLPNVGHSQCLHPGVVADLADSDNEDCPFNNCQEEGPVTVLTAESPRLKLSALLCCFFPKQQQYVFSCWYLTSKSITVCASNMEWDRMFKRLDLWSEITLGTPVTHSYWTKRSNELRFSNGVGLCMLSVCCVTVCWVDFKCLSQSWSWELCRAKAGCFVLAVDVSSCFLTVCKQTFEVLINHFICATILRPPAVFWSLWRHTWTVWKERKGRRQFLFFKTHSYSNLNTKMYLTLLQIHTCYTCWSSLYFFKSSVCVFYEYIVKLFYLKMKWTRRNEHYLSINICDCIRVFLLFVCRWDSQRRVSYVFMLYFVLCMFVHMSRYKFGAFFWMSAHLFPLF